MQSKISFFKGAVFRKTITRFWPLLVGYALLWLILIPISIVSSYQSGVSALVVDRSILYLAAEVSPVVTFCAGILAAMAALGWMYNHKSADFTAALPVRREAMFLSCVLAGLAALCLCHVAAFLAGWATSAVCGGQNLSALFQWLAITTLDTVSFYGFAIFCAVLTGNLLILPVVYVVLQFTAVVVENLVDYLLSCIVFGYAQTSSRFSFLSPLWTRMRTSTVLYGDSWNGKEWELAPPEFHGWGVAAAYAAAGVVLIVLALLIFRRRPMETASDTVAVPVLKPVFRWCMAVGCALCLGAFSYDVLFDGTNTAARTVVLWLFMLLGSFIGWFGADMLILKTFRVFRRHWKGWLLCGAILGALMLTFELDLPGIEKRVPAEEEYDRVYISSANAYSSLKGEEGMAAARQLHESILANKALHEDPANPYRRMVTIEYYRADDSLPNGDRLVLRRQYFINVSPEQQTDQSSDLRALERLMNLPEAVEFRKSIPIPVTVEGISHASIELYSVAGTDREPVVRTESGEQESVRLSDEEAYELYTTCLLPDIRDGTLGLVWLVDDEDFARSIYNLNIHMEVSAPSVRNDANDYDYAYFYTVPTVNSRRTNAWLERHGILLETYWDYLERMGDTEGMEAYLEPFATPYIPGYYGY